MKKIHAAIDRSKLVIAEISEPSPNVFYELGYAVGIKKQILLIAKVGTKIPADLHGLEVIPRPDDEHGAAAFEENLRANLDLFMERLKTSTSRALLRDMLTAENPLPAFIAASPRYPGQNSPEPTDERTCGDNLGVLGLLSAFGSIFGETRGVELVSGRNLAPDILERDLNLYVIGSQSANLIADRVMEMIQSGGRTSWRLAPSPKHEPSPKQEDDKDRPFSLYRREGRHEWEWTGTKAPGGGGPVEDYGVIMRGPHPKHPGRMLTVMAGPTSLGTGAACIAATRSEHVLKIREKMIEEKRIEISDRQRPFWVLVRGVANKDRLLDVEGVTIEEVGVYSKAAEASNAR